MPAQSRPRVPPVTAVGRFTARSTPRIWSGPPLSRAPWLPEGHAQTLGVGRAAIRGSQAMAWLTAVPLARARQREYGSAAGRDGAESQTVAGEGRLGAAPRAAGESPGSFHRSGESRHCFRLTWHAGSKRLAGHVFQQAEYLPIPGVSLRLTPVMSGSGLPLAVVDARGDQTV